MTERRYLDDSSVERFEATVERALDDRVVLDQTHFYPEGGGQPADRGTLAADGETWRVTDVQKKDTVYHTVEGTPPDAGTAVTGALDWERRWNHMRYHTAQHLLSAVLLTEFDAPTVGNQLYRDRARIDVEHPRFTETDLTDVAVRMNELVEAGLSVDWYQLDRAEAEATLDPERTRIDLLPDSISELRIVEIGEGEDVFDRTACAGTHVRDTSALGTFEVTGRESRGSDAERLRFVLAD
ncbi:MAG: alanyl-tRNA editing protein [Haloarculaceae archaeon]